MKYGIMGLLILILVICGALGGFDLALAAFFVILAILQFAHVWSRQSYVISFKDFIGPVLNLLVWIILLLAML